MDQTDNKVDQMLFNKASELRRDVPDHLWQHLEEKLDQRTYGRRWRMYSGVAASCLILVAFSFLLGLSDQTPEIITDLSSEPQNTYFKDYRDFIRSDRYAQLVSDYQAVR